MSKYLHSVTRALAQAHPVLGCYHAEGAIVNSTGDVTQWLPPVHDCAYIDARNASLGIRVSAAPKKKAPPPAP